MSEELLFYLGELTNLSRPASFRPVKGELSRDGEGQPVLPVAG